MIIFWVSLILVLCLAYLIFAPIFRRSASHRFVGRSELNLALYQERQDDLAPRPLAENLNDPLTIESERNLLNDLESAQEEPSEPDRSGRLTLVIALLLAPICATAIYFYLGRPDLLENPPLNPVVEAKQAVIELAKRIETNPNDLPGWVLLAQALERSGKPEDAAKAYEFAIKLAPENLNLQSAYAQTLAQVNQNSMMGKPEEIVKSILKKEPDNRSALWLSGLASAERKDFSYTIKQWSRLRELLPKDSPEFQEVSGVIAEVQSELEAASNAPQKGVPTKTKIKVQVALAKQLMKQADPNQTVFVFAKAASGPQMPLAAARLKVSDLPTEVVLDDSMAMQTGVSLSSFKNVIISARISKKGTPNRSLGDLQGQTEPLTPKQDKIYRVEINSVVTEQN